MSPTNAEQPADVVIVGAGFAGLSAYQVIKQQLPELDIRVIDVRSAFEYTPSLHLAIGSSRKAASISISFKTILGDSFVKDRVNSIERNQVVLSGGRRVEYRAVIITTGSSTNYFGQADFEKYTLPFKSLADVKLISQLLGDTSKKVTVIGGGYTGVELATVLAETGKHVVTVIHSRDRLLHTLAPLVSRQAARFLSQRQVRLLLGDRVERVGPNSVKLQSGTELESDVTIFTAGVKPNLDLIDQTLLDSQQDNSIFLAGDAYPAGLPTAHNAITQGRVVARQVIGKLTDEPQPSSARAHDWRILMIAFGRWHGMLTIGDRFGINLPWIVGLSKLVVEKVVLLSFRWGVKLPL